MFEGLVGYSVYINGVNFADYIVDEEDARPGRGQSGAKECDMVALLKMPSSDVERSGAERRLFTRKRMSLSIMGRRLDQVASAWRFPTLKMHLCDLSLGGASAITDEPVAKGEHLSISIPDMQNLAGWDARGRVLRCEPSSTGYRIAMEFDPLPAA